MANTITPLRRLTEVDLSTAFSPRLQLVTYIIAILTSWKHERALSSTKTILDGLNSLRDRVRQSKAISEHDWAFFEDPA